MSTTPDAEQASGWTAADIPDLAGRTFVVTGGNSGLGLVTCRALAARGGEVVMAVRDTERGEAAAAAIRAEDEDARVAVHRLDLADLDSVAEFADGLTSVDVLVNNAGIMMPPRSLSAQGHELQFAVNHLGHFALTARLLDVLKEGRDPRVVTVSSLMHRRGRLHFDDLDGEHRYSRAGFYSQSKLANVVFGLELHRRLRGNGFAVSSLLAHPGYSATNLQSTGPTGVARLALRLSNRVAAQEAAMGALPQLYAATSPDAESGQFIGPAGRREMKGPPTVVQPLDAARDRDLAKRLWDVSEELTGVAFGLAR